MTAITLYIIGVACASLIAAFGIIAMRYYLNAKEIAPYLLKLEEMKRRIAEAQSTLEALNAQIIAKGDALANADRLIADAEAAKQWLEDHRGAVEALQSAIVYQQQKLKEAEESYQKRQGELDKLTQQVANASVEYKRTVEECNQAVKDKNAVMVEKSRLDNEAKALGAKVDSLAKEYAILSNEVKELTDKRNELDAHVKKLEKDAERLRKQLTDEKEELATARKEVSSLEGRANDARRIIAEHTAIRDNNKECWADLDTPRFTDEKQFARKDINETKWLKKFQSDLRDCGFEFNERAILAFHTGLKCADISPLVVLAGISGTGKSLLPELYAAALGMNFLPVAVQPRWDSSQDMFGFYNYMEGRYKATELSRLLWQYDQFNNEKTFGLTAIPMNLVLLDEMNLARVEYYFSDLLSKLEMRRGIDPNDPVSRAKAEVEIESSAAASVNHRRRLFVAPNTLFVGTMNEDETTQTLSDKVIDRSNVLRFGRPEKLVTKPEKGKFLKIAEDALAITEGFWFNNWCNLTGDDVKAETLRRKIEPINAALSRAGRPFAHRVWQAMESYVVNYPGVFNDALADQIEMKILPKLNGIELDAPGFNEAAKELAGVIGELKDEKLHEAFEAACKDGSNPFFKWRGVMR